MCLPLENFVASARFRIDCRSFPDSRNCLDCRNFLGFPNPVAAIAAVDAAVAIAFATAAKATRNADKKPHPAGLIDYNSDKTFALKLPHSCCRIFIGNILLSKLPKAQFFTRFTAKKLSAINKAKKTLRTGQKIFTFLPISGKIK
jgi:hypothetical protein